MHRFAPALSLACALSLAACEPSVEAPPPGVPTVPTASASAAAPAPKVVKKTLDDVGLDEAALDRSVGPCDDFYQFACGSWIKNTEIPADKPLMSRSFVAIGDRNEELLHKILDDARAAGAGADPVTRAIGDYYGACMDEAAVEAQKLDPVKPMLDVVKKVKDDRSLAAAVIELHKHKAWAFFDVGDEQDFKDATRVIAEMDQNGIGLPDKDFYLKDDDRSKEVRAAYLAHVERVLALAGANAKAAKKGAEEVMRLETAIANVSKSKVERRDPAGMYNKIDRAGLAKAAPRFPWDRYFKELGIDGVTDVTVTSPRFFEGMNELLGTVKPAEWQPYLTWHAMRGSLALLGKTFVDEGFKMDATLSGQKEQKARWKRCVASTDSALGELLAQSFVKQRFSPESKEATVRYVREISAAFAKEVGQLDWMDAVTKEKALAKLGTMAYLIGYPSKWRAYDFPIKARAFASNMLAARAFDLRRRLNKIGKPVDREEWGMTPPTVNAYYRQPMNHMVFPAGILQPPFFNPAAGIAVNLGGMGMVVGHELTHGFDDKGSQFDGQGNLSKWWTDEVRAKFTAKTDCVMNQYAAYEVLPGVKQDGKLTLGENIADNAGVLLAFQAYRSMRGGATEVVEAGGFNEDQQFFLGVGQVWCAKLSDKITRLRAQTDTHSHPKWRVNGTLSNLPEFAEAFSCKQGAPMRRENACRVW